MPGTVCVDEDTVTNILNPQGAKCLSCSILDYF